MMAWLGTIMPSKPKTWKQKMNAKPPHTVVLDKDFAGVPAGARLLISCPVEVENYLRTKCRRRSKSEPPRRLNIEPGVEADVGMVGCG
jgi:hypothetical protein